MFHSILQRTRPWVLLHLAHSLAPLHCLIECPYCQHPKHCKPGSNIREPEISISLIQHTIAIFSRERNPNSPLIGLFIDFVSIQDFGHLLAMNPRGLQAKKSNFHWPTVKAAGGQI
jgi:hypothetical protein